jgi:hypothetical protein
MTKQFQSMMYPTFFSQTKQSIKKAVLALFLRETRESTLLQKLTKKRKW